MNPNPFLGVVFHWLGGLASGSFYVPYRGVKKWSWETYWLAGGFFSWIIMPWLLGLTMTNDLLGVLGHASHRTLFLAWLFGVMWGLGGLTFGLTMRYLGMSLGMGVALGFCAAFGTLIPPIFKGELAGIAASRAGQITLVGIAVCLAGIAVAALAGLSKERELPEEKKKEVIREFSFRKGMLVATFSGIMSASFAYGLDAAAPIAELSLKAGTTPIWSGLPKLVVVLLGGFTTNFIWCVILNLKNKTGYQYFSSTLRNSNPGRGQETIIETAVDVPSEEVVEHAPRTEVASDPRVPMLNNYLFSALAGTTWYFQFFFYTMGETQMGRFGFASWTLHMASIIIFSTMWGWIFHEWKGSSKKAHSLIASGIVMLILSTIIIGVGTWLKSKLTAQ